MTFLSREIYVIICQKTAHETCEQTGISMLHNVTYDHANDNNPNASLKRVESVNVDLNVHSKNFF